MGISQKIKHEVKAIIVVTLFFALWLGAFMGLKVLILEEFHIQFGGISKVLLGALILAKVVLILEHVSLGTWLNDKPVLVDVVLRTVIYGIGTLVVLLMENAFEARHEQGGFGNALMNVFQHRDIAHVCANAICMTGALFFYNVLVALQGHLGSGGLARVFFSPPENSKASKSVA